MIEEVGDLLSWLLALDAQQPNLWQMGLRAAIIYVTAVAMVRLVGDRRFIGKYAALDVLLGVILGSTLSRAINGSAPFFATLGAALVLVLMHWLFAAVACQYDRFDTLIKGHSRVLVRDGQINDHALRKSHITYKDLEATLRSVGKLTELTQVKIARLERSGQISIIPQNPSPQVIEVVVEAGVQTVKIELS
ncbi:YetF domain-containing protein [Lyngbya aestuarii]|uniref:YetF domain-containing protein n=1 Tax=Lyngbya aestuarii TaxID=118322 RepID=UPI00403D681C